MISVFAFGLIQFVSHFTYFMGYLETATTDHYEIAPLFNSFAICLAFLWSYCVYKLSINGEVILYLFLMYVGVIVCGYSFIKYGDGFDLLLRTSNIYLIISAFLESLSLILIKYANRVPTFILVCSQSVFCAVIGLILLKTSNAEFMAMN